MGSSHSSGPSSYEIAKQEAEAKAAEEKRLAAEKAGRIAAANASAAAGGGKVEGGKAEPYEGGALSRRKKTSTLAGEGEQTFGSNGSLGG